VRSHFGLSGWAIQDTTSHGKTKSDPRETTTKREPITNGEDQRSHLHPNELRRRHRWEPSLALV